MLSNLINPITAYAILILVALLFGAAGYCVGKWIWANDLATRIIVVTGFVLCYALESPLVWSVFVGFGAGMHISRHWKKDGSRLKWI